MDFKKFNEKYNTKELIKEVKEAAENGGSYDDAPTGEYVVKIDKMELKESKKGDPMFAVQFNIQEGRQKGHKIFMNQLITQGFQIHIVNEFLRSLECEIEFEDYVQYNDAILDCAEELDGVEFKIDYGENTKGYKTFKVLEIYE